MSRPNALRQLNLNWRRAALLAGAYLAISLLELFVAAPLLSASTHMFALAAFPSGPIGFLLGLPSTPEDWSNSMLLYYLVGTYVLALALTFSCHRNPTVRNLSILMAILVWLLSGFLAGVHSLAFAA